MYEAKIFWVLVIVVIASYSILMVLSQFDWFRKIKEQGVTFAFEGVLMMVALVVGFLGIWFNGYQRGLEDGSKTESDKT